MKNIQELTKTALPSIGRRSKRRPRSIEIDNLILKEIKTRLDRKDYFFTQATIAQSIKVDKSIVCKRIQKLCLAGKVKRQRRSIKLMRSMGWKGQSTSGCVSGYLYSLPKNS